MSSRINVYFKLLLYPELSDDSFKCYKSIYLYDHSVTYFNEPPTNKEVPIIKYKAA